MAAKKKWRRGLLGGHFLQIRVRARSDTKVTASNVKFNDFLLLVEAAS